MIQLRFYLVIRLHGQRYNWIWNKYRLLKEKTTRKFHRDNFLFGVLEHFTTGRKLSKLTTKIPRWWLAYHSFLSLASYLPFLTNLTHITDRFRPTCASSARNLSALIPRNHRRWAGWNIVKKNLVQHRMRIRNFTFDLHMFHICVHHFIFLPVYFFTRPSVAALGFNLLQQTELSCGTVFYALENSPKKIRALIG